MHPLSQQFVSYLVCSGTAAAINFVAGSILIHGVGLTSGVGYPFAIAAGYVLGMFVNFQLNRRYTFSSSERTRFEQGRTFVVVALSGLALTSLVAVLARAALRSGLSAYGESVIPFTGFLTAETLGQIVAIGAVSLYSFAGHKYLTFAGGIRAHLLKYAKVRW